MAITKNDYLEDNGRENPRKQEHACQQIIRETRLQLCLQVALKSLHSIGPLSPDRQKHKLLSLTAKWYLDIIQILRPDLETS